jgi:hypothetical protein
MDLVPAVAGITAQAELRRLIVENDSYHFLFPIIEAESSEQSDDSTSMTASRSDADQSESESEFEARSKFTPIAYFERFYFRHIMVQRGIKALWTTQTAKEIHRRLAEIHVAKLTPQNKTNLLPLIVRHFEDSGDIPALMEYLEKFGVHCAEQMLVAEGIPCFDKLRALVVSEGLENDPRFHAMRRSDWDRHSGDMLFQTRDIPRSLEYHMSALRWLGRDLPVKLEPKYFSRLLSDGTVHVFRLLAAPWSAYKPKTGRIARELRELERLIEEESSDCDKEIKDKTSSCGPKKEGKIVEMSRKLELGPESALAAAARSLLLTSVITESAYYESKIEICIIGLTMCLRMAEDIGAPASKIAYETMTMVSINVFVHMRFEKLTPCSSSIDVFLKFGRISTPVRFLPVPVGDAISVASFCFHFKKERY